MANEHIPDLSAASDFTTKNPIIGALLRDMMKTATPIGSNGESPIPRGIQKADPPQPAPASEAAATAVTNPALADPALAHPAPTHPDVAPALPPAETRSADTRCISAYNNAMKCAKDKGLADYYCTKAAERAFIDTIPRLHKPENIAGFIACITYAMLIGVIRLEEGTKYLYAAQIATQAMQGRPVGQKDCKSR